MTLIPFPRADIRYNTSANNILKVGPFTVAGVEVTPSTVTGLLYKPDGTAIGTTQTFTVSGSYATLNIDTTTTTTWALDEGYVCKVSMTSSATVYPYHVLFDVVRQPLPCLVGDTDLTAYYPDIANRKGSLSNYSAQILAAFEEVKGEIICKGFRPALMFDPASFRKPTVFRTLAILCVGAWKKEIGDRWQEDFEIWQTQYKDSIRTALETVSVRYDDDEDGLLDDGEREVTSPVRLLL